MATLLAGPAMMMVFVMFANLGEAADLPLENGGEAAKRP
jgi:hypothetical protein